MFKNPKAIILALIVPVLIFVIALNIALSLINKEQYKALLQERVKQFTGRELAIKNDPRVGIFPSPYIEFSGLELKQAKNSPYAPRIRADSLRVGIDWAEAFKSTPSISYVTLNKPVVEIERSAKGVVDWGELMQSWPHALMAGASEKGTPVNLVIQAQDGRFFYANPKNSVAEKVENISFTVKTGAAPLFGTANFLFRGKPANIGFTLGSESGAPVLLTLDHGNETKISFSGTRKDSENEFIVEGEFQGETSDLSAWIAPEAAQEAAVKTSSELSIFNWLNNNKVESASHSNALPGALKGNLVVHSDRMELDASLLKLDANEGSGKVTVAWGGEVPPSLVIDSKFHSVALTPLTKARWVAPAAEAPAVRSGSSISEPPVSPFATDFTIKLNAVADIVDYSERKYTDVSVSAEIAEGSLTLQQLRSSLPGDAVISVFGVMTQQMQGIRFEGTGEIEGKDLRETLVFFDSAADALPKQGMSKAFSIHSNLFISSNLLRVSEAALKIGDLDLLGGLVTYFEATPRVEADIKFKNTNLDYFRDIWKASHDDENNGEFKFFSSKGTEFGWLKRLGYIIDFKIALDGFTFLDHEGQTAGLRMYIRKNEFNLLGVRMYFPEGALDASFKLDVSNERPDISLVLNSPFLNSSYIMSDDQVKADPLIDLENAEKRWSEHLFDFSWMGLFTGDFDISAGAFQYGNFAFKNIKFKAALADQVLRIQNFSFDNFDGRFQSSGSLVGGKVPGLALSFTLYNIEIRDLLSYLPNLEMLSGRASLSGYISTSGIHFLSWLSHAEIKIVVAARGVRVQGFDLDGIINSVRAARSTADVVTSVNSRLHQGKTDFSIDGNINILNGIARTPGIALKSGITLGNLSGEVDILPWKMNLRTLFQFPQLSAETVPVLPIAMSGPINNFAVEADTSSLEAHVSKQIIGQ